MLRNAQPHFSAPLHEGRDARVRVERTLVSAAEPREVGQNRLTTDASEGGLIVVLAGRKELFDFHLPQGLHHTSGGWRGLKHLLLLRLLLARLTERLDGVLAIHPRRRHGVDLCEVAVDHVGVEVIQH